MSKKEDFFYIYPMENQLENIEEQLRSSAQNRRKIINKLCIFTLLFFTLFVIFCLPFAREFDYIFIISACIFLILDGYTLQIFMKHNIQHFLSINADSDSIELIYYSSLSKEFKKVLKLKYADIVKAKFSDNDYTSFQIVFNNSNDSKLTTYDINGNEMHSLSQNLFLFNLQPFSYEQGFFLYYAHSLFKIDGYFLDKKVYRKFGSETDYFEQINKQEG